MPWADRVERSPAEYKLSNYSPARPPLMRLRPFVCRERATYGVRAVSVMTSRTPLRAPTANGTPDSGSAFQPSAPPPSSLLLRASFRTGCIAPLVAEGGGEQGASPPGALTGILRIPAAAAAAAAAAANADKGNGTGANERSGASRRRCLQSGASFPAGRFRRPEDAAHEITGKLETGPRRAEPRRPAGRAVAQRACAVSARPVLHRAPPPRFTAPLLAGNQRQSRCEQRPLGDGGGGTAFSDTCREYKSQQPVDAAGDVHGLKVALRQT
ncbi:uncharacterized protein LOC124788497 [Schistocerca piceifrons]|uniref:uncharacterized protein LOC124788497 n=1 Tax=Schistocerca piceifrons TaxID=274613 RepID=UPI001F5F664C|nr:uncharacterized protein LOC124788497 [Schistocerca piceifrons]